MIDWLEALILGAVQGATEYLPVSSSGHLVIFQHLFGLAEPALLFDIVLHVATLLAVLWYYRRDIGHLIRQSLESVRELARGQKWSRVQTDFPGFRLTWMILLGTLPTGLIGITLEDTFEALFGSLRTVGVGLWITSLVLATTLFVARGRRGVSEMKPVDALLIGLVQGLAITPGISRSGSTIAVALLLGLERETAARYSFLLSVPSIFGALQLKIGDGGHAVAFFPTTLGFFSALVTGYLCLALLVHLVKRGKLAWFAPYCLLAGAFALFLAARL
jgi:undecaprenyl-diphosphatase